jgi:hypothetical protein
LAGLCVMALLGPPTALPTLPALPQVLFPLRAWPRVCVCVQLCPFDNVKQDYTSLGTWGSWESDHTVQLYTNGQYCHSGVVRQTTVKLECGSENTLGGVAEPSMCKYEMVLTTPAACV